MLNPLDKPSDTRSAQDIQDLLNHIDFDVKNGEIWFGDKRMLLNHAESLSKLKEDIIKILGKEATEHLFFRYGYYSGLHDAQIAKNIRPQASWKEAYLAGPQLHTIRGMVKVVPDTVKMDITTGEFFATFDWHNSFEVAYHRRHHGLADAPICHTLLGYASGYTSFFFGKQIAFIETQCGAMGHDCCRIEGRPLEDWSHTTLLHTAFEPEKINAQIFELRTPIDEIQRQHPFVSIEDYGFFNAVGQSKAFKNVIKLLSKVAKTKATVLLEGETGVGKEVFAQGLHQISNRANEPFVAINCASIPPELIESELFGVEKGAFTGAAHSRVGKIETANGGTLFLDEVVELSPRAQASLLRVLQEGQLFRVGSNQLITVDVRIIVATNESLEHAILSGKFRQDLYYRLNTFPIRIPPLRERVDDIMLLAEFFLKKFRDMYDKHVSSFDDTAKQALLEHPWQGNVRELQNVIERAVILTEENHLIHTQSLFPDALSPLTTPRLKISDSQRRLAPNTADTLTHFSNAPPDLDTIVELILAHKIDLERLTQTLIQTALHHCDGNISETARLLGISRAKLDYRLKHIAQP